MKDLIAIRHLLEDGHYTQSPQRTGVKKNIYLYNWFLKSHYLITSIIFYVSFYFHGCHLLVTDGSNFSLPSGSRSPPDRNTPEVEMINILRVVRDDCIVSI